MATYRFLVPALLVLIPVGLAQLSGQPGVRRFLDAALGFQALPVLAGLFGCDQSTGGLHGVLLLVQLPLVILSAVVYARLADYNKTLFALAGLFVGGLSVWIMFLGLMCTFRGFF